MYTIIMTQTTAQKYIVAVGGLEYSIENNSIGLGKKYLRIATKLCTLLNEEAADIYYGNDPED
ncbi:MAG: hypothetical protein ACTSPB_17635 [Candidatus Thorarchaeota archaeon]